MRSVYPIFSCLFLRLLFDNAEVLLAAEHVTVTKATVADWEELQDSKTTQEPERWRTK